MQRISIMRTARGKKRSFSLALLYFFEKSIGLCPLSLDDETIFKFSYFGIFYAIVLCILYSFNFFFAISNRVSVILTRESLISVITDSLTIIFQCATLIVSWLKFSFGQKKLQIIWQRIERTGEISRKLGIKDDRSEILKTLAYQALFVNIIFCGLYILHECINTIYYKLNLVIWAPQNFCHIVLHNMFIFFMTGLITLQRRFRYLNIKLRNFPMADFGINLSAYESKR